jgi:hypothetical protein
LGVDAPHVNLDFGDFLDVLNKEVETLLNESIDLEEVGRDKNCNCVFDV